MLGDSGPGGNPFAGQAGTGGGGLTTTSGIALSGAYILNALDANSNDAVQYELMTLDTCFSHPTSNGMYHYHIWSPCLRKQMGLANNS